jgi:cell division protein FtsI (penicillin-binding protein 3)
VPAPRTRPRVRRTKGLRLKTGPFRLWSAFCVVAFVISLFAARLVQLQGIDENDYAAIAAAKGAKTITLEAPRAPIYDRNGVELAQTVDASKLVADPTDAHQDATKIAVILHRRLGVDYIDAVSKLRKTSTRYVELARHVKPELAAAVVRQIQHRGYPGVYAADDTLRIYPNGNVAANLVGFVNDEGHGGAGFESSLDTLLSGVNGSATFEVADGQQLPLADSTIVAPKEGTGVRLTIDRDLQFLAQNRLAEAVRQARGTSGYAVIMDVKTGQTLALADVPTFDPNKRELSSPDTYGSEALQNVYEPGSVEKVLTFSSLIDAGYASPREKLTVPTVLPRGDATIHDYFYHPTLHLTATGVVAKSSNIGTVLAAQDMPDHQFYDYLRSFGLGSRTDVGLDGESPGLLPKAKDWLPINHDTIAFGQGLSVNALQMAAAISAVANGGVYVQPSLVEGYVDSAGHFTKADAPKEHRVIKASTASKVARMMEAVTGPDGTAPTANINGYRVAGKTGTAQRVSETCGCYDGSFTVSFAGFAPADDPRFVVYVVVQQPKDGNGGGMTGGPVFHDLMAATLQKFGVPPTGSRQRPLPVEW